MWHGKGNARLTDRERHEDSIDEDYEARSRRRTRRRAGQASDKAAAHATYQPRSVTKQDARSTAAAPHRSTPQSIPYRTTVPYQLKTRRLYFRLGLCGQSSCGGWVERVGMMVVVVVVVVGILAASFGRE